MKISIQLDIKPEEIPLATDLLALLAKLAKEGVTTNTTVEASTVLSPAQVFGDVLRQIESPDADLDTISNEALQILHQSRPDILHLLLQEFENIVFDPLLLERNQSVLPFFYILARLQEPQKTLVRDILVPYIIKALTIGRPINCNRIEFFAYAEAFAALIKLEYIPIIGAISTMMALLQKPETRCVAVTMLGKTVELCVDVITEKCDPSKLQELRNCVQKFVREEEFRYDLDYINENMGWISPTISPNNNNNIPPLSTTPPPGTRGPSPPISTNTTINNNDNNNSIPTTTTTTKQKPEVALRATNSFMGGHSGTIFSICYDAERENLISCGKDGLIVSWNKDGKIKEKIQIPKHYACSTDISPKHKSMFVCGVPKETGNNAAILAYTLNEKDQWVLRGTLERPEIKIISCVKALSNDTKNLFVTGESFKTPGEKEKVRVYDASTSLTGNAFSKLSPIVSYEEHDDMITCLANHPQQQENLFFSGSRDCTIKMWDSRVPRAVGALCAFQNNGKRVAHEGMITCLDTRDHLLVSGSLDKHVAIWDLRRLSTGGVAPPLKKQLVDESAILKVAIAPSCATIAISTLKGLCLPNNITATPFKDNRKMGRYHDLKWTDKFTLYAAGDDMRVDQFMLREVIKN